MFIKRIERQNSGAYTNNQIHSLSFISIIQQYAVNSFAVQLSLLVCLFVFLAGKIKEFRITSNMASSLDQTFQFDLDLPDVIRSLSFYCTDENGEKQLRFDPPVYQARYSAVISVLSKTDWIPHIKKVNFERNLSIWLTFEIGKKKLKCFLIFDLKLK